QEPWGFGGGWQGSVPREPKQLASMLDVKRIFDGYDVGIRYADHAVGILVDRLDQLGVLDETAILVSSDHGEAFGELGVYTDHHGADEATTHIPSVLRWPGIRPRVDSGLHYHLDVAATILELAGASVPEEIWDGRSFAAALHAGHDSGREHLVLTQGAWSCQRGVRFGDHLYLKTWHDGYHGWPEDMLFDLRIDPHETSDLVSTCPQVVEQGRTILGDWTSEQLTRSAIPVDPMESVLAEGGPGHCRGELPAYLERLRATGRADWADELRRRHPHEAGPDYWVDFRQSMEALGKDLMPFLAKAGNRTA
ncbi:MAG TPA: sulfatase-like hydrolase/transferase, partial [Acidimicrobiales bacterium]|nr:sulfatase-like hydrolase/transferase [Acidimicrobiales bacterium]